MKWIYRPDDPRADAFGCVEKDIDEAPQSSGVFHYWPDIPSYLSPLGNGEISSRTHRKEELKRNHCVEVEPSSGPHRDGSRYQNRDFIRKHNIPINEGEQ
jgi:hypothetical protein